MKSQAKKAIIVYDSGKSAPYRYRCENFCEVLKNSEKWQITSFSKKSTQEIVAKLKSTDLIILQRLKYSFSLQKIINLAHEKHIPIIYDLDDLVFSPKFARLIYQTTKDQNIFYWFRYTLFVKEIAKRVDGFLVSNRFLGEKISQEFQKPFISIPNFLNKKQIQISEKLCESKKQNQNFTIGYFSGSSTHTKDFFLIEKELSLFLDKYSDVKLRIVGDLETNTLQKYKKTKQLEIIPKVSYQKLQALISEVDINLAPLIENDFTNCKSELKFFEAAAVKTTTIASPTFAFKNAMKDGETGFLCKPGEWFERLEYLYNNPKENRRVAENAHKYCLENYYGKKILQQIEKAYDEFTK